MGLINWAVQDKLTQYEQSYLERYTQEIPQIDCLEGFVSTDTLPQGMHVKGVYNNITIIKKRGRFNIIVFDFEEDAVCYFNVYTFFNQAMDKFKELVTIYFQGVE